MAMGFRKLNGGGGVTRNFTKGAKLARADPVLRNALSYFILQINEANVHCGIVTIKHLLNILLTFY